ncbi:conserved exported hypothetical protein [Bosea sp. 62]|uniref:hypothetical protein n=1 Tax=unclassified Bosea (in: a-proteobacteria) TaxID=2653178 RepID=UPI001259D709|nr:MULTISPECIES: hypothetical protein [unclassified Bosea (in: a-proteobacteria)]CAD5264800.1 conserved exported hypothetical protein [Bosea sp. 46]CAD5267098.1 conserved exported hypothetical protein [Bosea sp. 21B]CAD5272113.1 conserved exported hypothetical protein [Bosea sp. 7B]VVT55964.1 conserved exported hypothetical protein [Bosea sp. EC-HK365B]VXB83863.1 conserved exported hypothetical protein [Bosea sp. 29B]
MLRIALLAAGLVFASPAAFAQAQPAPAAPKPAAAAADEPVPRAARAEARRDCYAENIALSGDDLRRAMRECMQERFPGVKLYASDGLTRDGKPTAVTVRAVCKQEADASGLKGAERTAALVACFNGKRPDLAQRAECRKEARGKGLDGDALKAAIAECGRNPQG